LSGDAVRLSTFCAARQILLPVGDSPAVKRWCIRAFNNTI